VKKVIKIYLAMLIICCAMITNVNATFSGTMNLKTDKTEFKTNEEFVVEAALSEGKEEENGIIVLGATLEYDKDALTLVSIDGVNGWSSPTYNEANGKLVTDRNNFSTGNETVFKITFKANKPISSTDLVQLKDIAVADGDIETKLGDTKLKLTISGSTNSEDQANNDNNQSSNDNNNNGTNSNTNNGNQVDNGNNNQVATDNNNNNTNSNNNNVNKNQSTSTSKNSTPINTTGVSNTVLPYTGNTNINTIIAILIFVVALVAIGFYFKIKKVDEEIENEKNK
jgi:LPXTG-motif cell wall-anchored protein